MRYLVSSAMDCTLRVWDLDDGDVEAGADPRWKTVGKGSTEDGGIFR